jgi:hypothetical protein
MSLATWPLRDIVLQAVGLFAALQGYLEHSHDLLLGSPHAISTGPEPSWAPTCSTCWTSSDGATSHPFLGPEKKAFRGTRKSQTSIFRSIKAKPLVVQGKELGFHKLNNAKERCDSVILIRNNGLTSPVQNYTNYCTGLLHTTKLY